MSVPAVAQLAREGLDLPAGVTFLVGENGSGKSTLVESIAVAYGLSPEGGPTHNPRSGRTHDGIGRELRVVRGASASRWGFFLRAETMHGWYGFLDARGEVAEPTYLEMSHGESFLAVLQTRFTSPGFYCLDEPEAALSFSSTLALMSALRDVADLGAQVLCATHSPVLASLPGATILEVGDWGYRRTTWAELELVTHWKAYLDDPGRYLRHVLD
jgi:predicted ATPase